MQPWVGQQELTALLGTGSSITNFDQWGGRSVFTGRRPTRVDRRGSRGSRDPTGTAVPSLSAFVVSAQSSHLSSTHGHSSAASRPLQTWPGAGDTWAAGSGGGGAGINHRLAWGGRQAWGASAAGSSGSRFLRRCCQGAEEECRLKDRSSKKKKKEWPWFWGSRGEKGSVAPTTQKGGGEQFSAFQVWNPITQI